jgi:5'-3' exonuclease
VPLFRLRGGGIAGFQRWFISQFPESVIKVQDGDGDVFDHVAFDMNGLLHSACLKAKTLEHAVLRIFRDLDATLRVLQPRKSVVLAFDGPGPDRNSEIQSSSPISKQN